MQTGLLDKNGNEIGIGDKVRLVVDGEERIFEVCFKTVKRTVERCAHVNITGVVFVWNGYDLFPCVDENGVPDNEKMEIIEKAERKN